jgi:hypothetical protein
MYRTSSRCRVDWCDSLGPGKRIENKSFTPAVPSRTSVVSERVPTGSPPPRGGAISGVSCPACLVQAVPPGSGGGKGCRVQEGRQLAWNRALGPPQEHCAAGFPSRAKAAKRADCRSEGGRVVAAPFEIRIGKCTVVSDPFGNLLNLLDIGKVR